MKQFWHCSLAVVLVGAPLFAAQEPLADCQQLVVVVSNDWDAMQASMQRFERPADSLGWQEVGEAIPVVLGKRGMAWGIGLYPMPAETGLGKCEGDYRSPAGIFALSSAFGLATTEQMSHLKMPYQQLYSGIEAVDDPNSVFYNQIVDRAQIVYPDWQSSELMCQVSLYAYGVVVDHNFPSPIPYAGSAIFLHLWRSAEQGTAGCTAMSSAALLSLLAWLDSAKNPVLAQFPKESYRQLSAQLNLPGQVATTPYQMEREND